LLEYPGAWRIFSTEDMYSMCLVSELRETGLRHWTPWPDLPKGTGSGTRIEKIESSQVILSEEVNSPRFGGV
jgi:hypothetical protein